VCVDLKMLAQPSRIVLYQVPAWNQQTRGMATLKSISMRLKSVKNIQKITQSMKMVSAAKYARAERELKLARPFGAGAQAFYEKAEVKPPEDPKAKNLIIAMTSDRGLCGAVHTSVGRMIRNEMNSIPGEKENIAIVCIGDKARNILQRLFGKHIILACKKLAEWFQHLMMLQKYLKPFLIAATNTTLARLFSIDSNLSSRTTHQPCQSSVWLPSIRHQS